MAAKKRAAKKTTIHSQISASLAEALARSAERNRRTKTAELTIALEKHLGRKSLK